MDCRDFKANLMEYIEEEVSISLKSSMEEHMSCCEACNELYHKRVQARGEMERGLDTSMITFQSKSAEVLGKIDSSKYGPGIIKNLRKYFSQNRGLYTACAAALIFILLLSPGIVNRYREWGGKPLNVGSNREIEPGKIAATVEENLDKIVDNKAAALSSNPYDYVKAGKESYEKIISLGKPAADYMLEKFATTDTNGLKEYIMAIACAEILKDNIGNGQVSSGREWYNSYVSRQEGSFLLTITNSRGPVEIKDHELSKLLEYTVDTNYITTETKDNGCPFVNRAVITSKGVKLAAFYITGDSCYTVRREDGLIVKLPKNIYDKVEGYMKEKNNTLDGASQGSSNENANPTGDGISKDTSGVDRSKLVNTLKELKGMPPGVGGWITVYSSRDRLVFYNYRHLLVYDNTPENKGIYRILDFDGLNMGYYQGSSVVRFDVSPDGRKCIIWNLNTEHQPMPLYLYDVEGDKLTKLTDSIEAGKYTREWSKDSKYFICTNEAGKEGTIYDTDTGKALNVNMLIQNNISKFVPEEHYPKITEQLMSGCRVALDENTTVDLDGKFTGYWSIKDKNTVIGVTFTEGGDLKLGDFQIIEIDINSKKNKVVFKP